MAELQKALVEKIEQKALTMRKHAIMMSLNAGPRGAHLGPGFSIMDILATLYFGVLRKKPDDPSWNDRDRFILSKGHGVLALYTVLAEDGYFPTELLKTFDTAQSALAGHPCMNLDLGIEASTGALGHGLSIGVGIALSAKLKGQSFDTYVLIGDGESNEGMIWEAAMAAAHYKLDNLVVIVDRNKLQADGFCRDIMDMGDIAEKWKSFGWVVNEVDGHNIKDLLEAFHQKNRPKHLPYAVIAHTTKGKGISFFENNKTWHHYRNFSVEQAEMALAELASCDNKESDSFGEL